MYQKNGRNISASLPSHSVPVPVSRQWLQHNSCLLRRWQRGKSIESLTAVKLGSHTSASPFSISSLTFSRNSDWLDALVFIKSLVAGPYHFIIHLVLMMGCSVTTCISWLLERLMLRAPLCPLFKISIILSLFYSFGTSAVIFVSSNAITSGSEVQFS